MSSKQLPPELVDAWDEAFRNPGVAIMVGRVVACDACDASWTDRPESGGMIFTDKAICPDCTPRWRANAVRFGEEHFERATCPAGQSFADFVREFRGPNAAIRVAR